MDEIGFAVLGHVVQRLLKDSVDICLQAVGYFAFHEVNLLFDVDSRVDSLKLPTEPRNRRQDTQIIEGRRPQVHSDPPDFVHGLLDLRD